MVSTSSHSLFWKNRGETIEITPWGNNSARVRITRAPKFTENRWALLDPHETESQIGTGKLTNGKLTVEIAADGKLRFLRDTELLVEEKERRFRAERGDLWNVELAFNANVGERFYGLGQHQHGFLDQKGCVIKLEQRNTEVTIPFLVSNRHYGLLWNNPGIGRVELANNHSLWNSYACWEIDFWITAGDSYQEIMAQYADATGHAPQIPHFATGFWQSKLRYGTQQELMDVAREYKRRELPLSVIVIDYFHWTAMGDWKFDSEAWPNPAAMTKELREMGIELMISVWPTVNVISENFEEMQRLGYLLETERGVPAVTRFVDSKPDGPVYIHHYDPTNPDARKYHFSKIQKNYCKHGIRVFWLDACEPEVYPADHDNLRYHLGNGLSVGCLFPKVHQQAYEEGLRSIGETEIITLCRSAWAGSQRHGAAVWSGDIHSTFEDLQRQVRGGLNIGLSGIPWWTTDIGGFHGAAIDTPYFQELIVRWFQFGVFCPLFRLHGARMPASEKFGGPNEIWQFGDRAYTIITEILHLRERLRPYITEQMKLASDFGTPVMRPLFFDFEHDSTCYEIEDQYMFGPDILVAPVLHEGAISRKVYLPKGATWRDVYTNSILQGGTWIEADAPLNCIPVYVKAESKLATIINPQLQ